MKRILLAIVFLSAFGLATSAFAENETVIVGHNTTFTIFNFNEPRIQSDPVYPVLDSPVVWHADASIFGPGNAFVISNYDQAGTAFASIGIDFDWELGGYTWDDIKNETVIVTFEFSFTLNSSFTVGSGATFAGVSFNGSSIEWYEEIANGTGNMSSTGTNLSGFQTTVEGLDNMGRRLTFYAFADAATTLDNITNAASADFNLVRITIEFPNMHSKKGGGCAMSESPEPFESAALLVPLIFAALILAARRRIG